jgi:DNA-binding response OmpR family regulator
MTRVLVVEDEPRLARSLQVGLHDENYVVDVGTDGEVALWHAVRAAGADVPILMLTACDTTADVVAGLDAGADDYLTKPFELAELLARLRALLRRGARGGTARLCVAHLELDTAARAATLAGRELPLTNMEYRLLEFLMRHAGSVQSRQRIAAALWHDETGPESNVLEVLISGLRRKLQAGSAEHLLQTRRGVGYLLAEPSP